MPPSLLKRMMLSKNSTRGLRNVFLPWIGDFPKGRTFVRVAHSPSGLLVATSFILQGFVLVPLLLLVDVDDLPPTFQLPRLAYAGGLKLRPRSNQRQSRRPCSVILMHCPVGLLYSLCRSLGPNAHKSQSQGKNPMWFTILEKIHPGGPYVKKDHGLCSSKDTQMWASFSRQPVAPLYS